jgi:hypothetical protein
MGIGDDLREAFAGVAEAVGGVRKVMHAAGAVADRVDGAVDHMTHEATVARILGAALDAGGREVTTAAVRSSRPGAQARRKCLGIACNRHGSQPWSVWRKTLVCGSEGCGRIYQAANANGRHFAPAVCACGTRLLPPTVPDGKLSSGEPLCSSCFDEIVSGAGRAVRGGSGRTAASDTGGTGPDQRGRER